MMERTDRRLSSTTELTRSRTRDAVIVGAVRTPSGKAKPGGLHTGTHPVDLLAGALRSLAERTGIPATSKVLRNAGLSIEDIDLFEVNEAFASVVLAWQRETGADLARVNVKGGAIALGHPLGASGARLLTTLVHAMHERGAR